MSPSGMGFGDYVPVHGSLPKYGVVHSLREGDQLHIQLVDKCVNGYLDTRMPIRFYGYDDAKLFDGVINRNNVVHLGGNWLQQDIIATGWDVELKGMDLIDSIVYDDWTPNAMFTDITRIINDIAIKRKAHFVYDTSKIPYYQSPFSDAYEATSGTEIIFSNIYEGLKTILMHLDATETNSPYDFGLRIETLPSAVGDSWEIDDAESEANIYILPFIQREDVAAKASYKTFKLEAGFEVNRDYSRLLNHVKCFGDGVVTQMIRTDKLLDQVDITSNDQWFPRTRQCLEDRYLVFTITNPTAFDESGYVTWVRVDGTTNPTETFPVKIPAGKSQVFYSSDRSADGLPTGNVFRCVYLNGCRMFVEEVTSDDFPHGTSIAGKSVNDFGHKMLLITGLWLNTQAKANYYSAKHVSLFHYPVHTVNVPILDDYVDYANLLGKPVDVYSAFADDEEKFICTEASWEFTGTMITQCLKGERHQLEWDENSV